MRLAEMPISSSAAAGCAAILRPRLAPSAASKPQSTSDGALGVADDPDEVVDGVGPIVVVGGDEALEALALG